MTTSEEFKENELTEQSENAIIDYDKGVNNSSKSPKKQNPFNKKNAQEEKAKFALEAQEIEKLCQTTQATSESYTVEGFEQIGEGIVLALLDMCEINPISRVPNSPFKDFKTLKTNIALNVLKDPPFRFDTYLRKIARNMG